MAILDWNMLSISSKYTWDFEDSMKNFRNKIWIYVEVIFWMN